MKSVALAVEGHNIESTRVNKKKSQNAHHATHKLPIYQYQKQPLKGRCYYLSIKKKPYTLGDNEIMSK